MENTISIRLVLDRVMKHPLMQDLSFESAVDYIIDFIRIIGIPRIFEDKVVTLNVSDYRVSMPCDWLSTIQVRENCSSTCMRSTTDSFAMGGKEQPPSEYTFRVQGSILYTNLREGTIDLAYKSLAIDEDGYPLVPDDPSILRAMEFYIKKQWFTILFDLGRIQPAVLQNVQQEYAFYVGQAQNRLLMPSLSEMESITNMWVSLLHKTNEFKYGFKNTGSKELLREHH